MLVQALQLLEKEAAIEANPRRGRLITRLKHGLKERACLSCDLLSGVTGGAGGISSCSHGRQSGEKSCNRADPVQHVVHDATVRVRVDAARRQHSSGPIAVAGERSARPLASSSRFAR